MWILFGRPFSWRRRDEPRGTNLFRWLALDAGSIHGPELVAQHDESPLVAISLFRSESDQVLDVQAAGDASEVDE